MGLFLLLRTYPLWDDSVWLRITIAVFGLVTAVVATMIARVQSSTKTQIAYASITQIGIMFIEVAAGLHWLALLHFVSNASLRTYQLLISPSVVGYLVHDQFFNFAAPTQRIKNTALGKLRASLYILSIKEWNMNTAVSHYLWKPLKSIGRVFAFLDKVPAQTASLVVFVAAMAITASLSLSAGATLAVSTAMALVGIIFYTRAFTTKGAATTAWNLIMLGHLFGALFLILAADNWSYLAMYGAGIVAAFIVGHLCLRYLKTRGESTELQEYHGAMYVHTKLGHLFFVVTLLFMTFPISSSFLAQDILLSFIPLDRAFQVALFGLSYLLMGVAAMRLYTKVFFGPHISSHHEKAYRSS
jgi:NADH:ubiquinone oxidoreductase subunit 5 (subunit L)/multisubunit Na+/H+ antiporter MnhA subunit